MTGLIGHTKRAVENERRRCVAFSGDVASSAFCRAVVRDAANVRAILEAQAISAFVADPNRQEPRFYLCGRRITSDIFREAAPAFVR